MVDFAFRVGEGKEDSGLQDFPHFASESVWNSVLDQPAIVVRPDNLHSPAEIFKVLEPRLFLDSLFSPTKYGRVGHRENIRKGYSKRERKSNFLASPTNPKVYPSPLRGFFLMSFARRKCSIWAGSRGMSCK